MFLRYYVFLDRPIQDCERELLGAPETWLAGVAAEVDGRATHLLVDVGLKFGVGRLTKRVEVQLGEPLRLGSWTRIPLAWRATTLPSMFPTLEGDLTLEPMGPGRTKLALAAIYQPPLGSIGSTVDKALMHTVAEATIKDLVETVASRLDGRITRASERRRQAADAGGG